jgi:hypothetical protein
MIGLPQLKARVARLDQLEEGLVAELKVWETADSALLPGEREQYLDAIQGAAVGLYEARDCLEAVVQRLEGGRF